MFIKTSFVALAAVVAMGASARAATDDGETTAPVTIRTADLDLHSRAGAGALLHRIEFAARTVCGEEPTLRDIKGHAAYRACVRSKVDETVAAVHSPMLASLNDPAGSQILASSDR
jgi:UrcA family protein